MGGIMGVEESRSLDYGVVMNEGRTLWRCETIIIAAVAMGILVPLDEIEDTNETTLSQS